MPDFDFKAVDHKHFDDWKNIYYGEEDKYEFQYLPFHADIRVNGGTPLVSQEEYSYSPQ